MNNIRYEYRYQQLGYELNQKKDEVPEKEDAQEVNQAYENTNFLNLPKGFKLGG